MGSEIVQIAASELGRSAPIIGFIWFYLRELRADVREKIGNLSEDVAALKLQVASQSTELKFAHHKELIDELKADVSALKLTQTHIGDKHGRNHLN